MRDGVYLLLWAIGGVTLGVMIGLVFGGITTPVAIGLLVVLVMFVVTRQIMRNR